MTLNGYCKCDEAKSKMNTIQIIIYVDVENTFSTFRTSVCCRAFGSSGSSSTIPSVCRVFRDALPHFDR